MKQTRLLMGMPITLEIADAASSEIFDEVFTYFENIDNKFSTYKATSEISRINRGEIGPENFSSDMREVFTLSERTKHDTYGYFDIMHGDMCDPSGLVKGWSVNNAARFLQRRGFRNFYIDAGGDIQALGKNSFAEPWKIGIRNPFDGREIVKVLLISNRGVATSGNYERGGHIYVPKTGAVADDIASLSVIGPDVYEADRFATAGFAMGRRGIRFIEDLQGFEGYMVEKSGRAVSTSGLKNYILENAPTY